MKVLVLCGLVALALASSPRWEQRRSGEIRDEAFRAGREYRYAFDGQVSTGLPQSSAQHASTRVQAEVMIVLRDQTTALLQLQRVRFGSSNREIPEPRQVQPFASFEEQTLSDEQKKQLELPLRFRYEDGIVSAIEFHREDVSWSENIKRSVLNLIQVNIQKTGRTDQQEVRMLKEEEAENQNKKFDYFTVPERTLEGNCEVAYTMTAQRESEPKLSVSKSVNFESCSERPDIRYNFRFGEQCNTCDKKLAEKERQLSLLSSSTFNYNITGTPSQFLIREAEVRSQYVFAPLNEQESTISSYVSAKIELIETSEEKSVEEPKSPKKQQSLLYSTQWDAQKERLHMTGNNEFTKNTPYTDSKQKVEMVQKIVAQIVKEMSDEQTGIKIEASHQMARLVKVLRMCDEDEILSIHQNVFENAKADRMEAEQIKDIITDALALAGTKHTIKHLMDKIQERQITPLKASYVLKALVNVRTVSQQHIELVHELCKSQTAKRNPMLKQSCWLTFGAMVNGMCAENDDQLAIEIEESEDLKKMHCSRDLKQKYTKIMVELFEKAESRYEKVLALKTLANAGIDVSVFPLEKIIRDRTEEKTIRMQAIDALRQLRSIMPRKIQNILMPIYKNKFEHADVRISAFAQVMHTLPERHILDQIVAQLEKERSQHVEAFVYSTFLSYANSTNPCEKQLSEDVQMALRLARVDQQSIPLSVFKTLPIYSEEYKSGWTLNWGSIFSNDSYLPKELSASIDTVLMGEWNKYAAQIGFTQQNLDQVIARLYRKVKQDGLDEVVVRGKRSSSFRPTDILRSIFEKLSIKSRSNDAEDPHAFIYIRYKDLDYAVLPLDEQTLPDVIKQVVRNGKLQLSEIERVLAQGYHFSTSVASFFYEQSRKIPTTLGMPLVINAKIPTIAHIQGQISAELTPQNSEKLTGLKLRLVAQPQIASTHVTKVEIWSPIANTGLKLLHSIQVNLPIDASIQVNVEKKLQIKTTVKAPEMKKRVLVIHTRPVTFVRSWPRNSRSYVEPKEKTIYSEQFDKQMMNVQREYGEESMGVKISVEGDFHRQPFTSVEGSPLPIFAGENVLSIYVQPGKDTPREYIFEADVETFIETSSMPKPTNMKQFYSRKTSSRVSSDELFDTESHEEEQQDELERRQSYGRYVDNYSSEKGYKHRMNLKAKTSGSQNERRIETLIEAVCDENVRHCQLKVEAERTPLPTESRKWNLNIEASTLYPETPKSLKELKEQKHREFTGLISAKWGSEKKSSVEIKLQGEQNREQKSWMRLVERKQNGIIGDDYLVEASHLNQYKADVQYDLQPSTKNLVNKLYQYVKSSYYWNIEQQLVEEHPEGQIQAQLTIEPETRRFVNLSISTPDEKVRIVDARLPIRLGLNIRRQPTSGSVRSLHQFVKNTMEEQRAECSVKGSKIDTFDEVVYKAPITTCYSVLAKDCSSSQPTFAVLMKKINKNSEEKKVKIIDEQNVIEIEYKNQDFVVKVNNKKVEDESTLAINGIREDGEVMVVELEEVVVRFDGFNIKIRLSQFYRSQQCGLCGHYDGERGDELRRADNELTDDLQDFHRSYFSQDDECEMEEKINDKRNYRLIESSESSSQENSNEDNDEQEPSQKNKQGQYQYDGEQDIKKPIQKTKVIEYNHRICFSKEAVPECPRKSYPTEETSDKKVKFACIERSHPEAQKLTRLSRKQVVNVDSYADSFVESLPVPKACVAY